VSRNVVMEAVSAVSVIPSYLWYINGTSEIKGFSLCN